MLEDGFDEGEGEVFAGEAGVVAHVLHVEAIERDAGDVLDFVRENDLFVGGAVGTLIGFRVAKDFLLANPLIVSIDETKRDRAARAAVEMKHGVVSGAGARIGFEIDVADGRQWREAVLRAVEFEGGIEKRADAGILNRELARVDTTAGEGEREKGDENSGASQAERIAGGSESGANCGLHQRNILAHAGNGGGRM